MPAPLTFELIAAAYFGVLALAALSRQSGPWARRVSLLAAIGAAGVLAAATGLPFAARVWLGPVYLLAGYWLPALLVPRARAMTAPLTPFESWLARSDDRSWRFIPTPPAWLAHVFEVSYLICAPLVPAAFAIVWTRGTPEDANRYWTALLVSGFICYGTLPWLVARPPRLMVDATPTVPRRLNLWILDRFSHQLATFPSGHVAVSTAAALEVWPLSPPAGAILVAIAAAIAAGAACGRYHYLIDVALGLLVGAVVAAAV